MRWQKGWCPFSVSNVSDLTLLLLAEPNLFCHAILVWISKRGCWGERRKKYTLVTQIRCSYSDMNQHSAMRNGGWQKIKKVWCPVFPPGHNVCSWTAYCQLTKHEACVRSYLLAFDELPKFSAKGAAKQPYIRPPTCPALVLQQSSWLATDTGNSFLFGCCRRTHINASHMVQWNTQNETATAQVQSCKVWYNALKHMHNVIFKSLVRWFCCLYRGDIMWAELCSTSSPGLLCKHSFPPDILSIFSEVNLLC